MKFKVTVSILLLIVLLVTAAYFSYREFNSLSSSIDNVLKNNYESIKFSKDMLEAVTEESNGIVKYILNDKSTELKIIDDCFNKMNNAIGDAKKNITEKDEEKLILTIEKEYNQFHEAVLLILNTEQSETMEAIYDDKIYNNLIKLQENINILIEVNQDKMYEKSDFLKQSGHRTLMPILVSIGASVIFVLTLLFFFYIYVLQPVSTITNLVKEHPSDKSFIDARLSINDEFNKLIEEINNLIGRIKSRQ